MALTPGTRLGPYEIVSPIGAGGMGEVYRGRDTRLGRTVAIKVLSGALADDPDFQLRFEREATAISQLSHPHICVLHDVGQEKTSDRATVSYLVMEHLEGQTLASRLEKGPLPVDQALRHAAAIADALDTAHRQGIVHRDLKPANVMLTKTGAKLLDFGLAKPKSRPVGEETQLATPPRNAPVTTHGTILGTFQYMAPEQVEGREADARSDIWAFGCVLYEMITGKPAFEGSNQASLIGAILHREPPPPSAVQLLLPPALDRVVRTCLAKDPDERWQNAHDLAAELRWITEGSTQPVAAQGRSPSRPGWLAFAGGGLAVGAVLASAVWWSMAGGAPGRSVQVRALAPLGAGQAMVLGSRRPLAVSPDGRMVAYAATVGGRSQVYVRRIDQMDAVPLSGTEGGSGPFFSHDGQWVGFFVAVEGRLKRVALSGGAPITICEAPDVRGASWGADDTIVYTPQLDAGLMRVAVGGGTPEVLTRPDASRREKTHRYPDVLPNRRGVLFTIGTHDITSFADARIAVYDTATGQFKIIIDGGSDARYQAPGYITVRPCGEPDCRAV